MSSRFRNIGIQGEPWQVMYINVMNRLHRTTALFPLRLNVDQVAGPCFPEELWSTSQRWHNLRSCITRFSYVQFIRQSIPFWMELPTEDGRQWPSSAEGVFIGDSHPHVGAIDAWITSANDHDTFLGESRLYLNKLFKVLKHPTWVQKYWPDIFLYVGNIPTAMVKGLREPIDRQVKMDTGLNFRIIDMLTAASLLPPEAEAQSWVGIYGQKDPV